MEKTKDQVKRIKTGISGMDNLLKGGLLENRVYVVVGTCGTGKSIFGLEYIYNGATKFNEPGVIVNLEEDRETMMKNVKSLDWDFESLEKKNMVRIIPYMKSIIGDIKNSLTKEFSGVVTERAIKNLIFSTMLELIREAVLEIKAKRLVIDPWTAITMMTESDSVARMQTMFLFDELRKLGVTSILGIEKESGYWDQLKFLANGVIDLDYVHGEGKNYRGLAITKMRGMSFIEGYYNFTISNKGIKVDTESIFKM